MLVRYNEGYPYVAQFPCPVLEFDFGMNCCQVTNILRCVGLVTGFASVFCGSRAEASRKHRGRNACPNNGTPRRCPHKVKSPSSKRKRHKKAKMKGNEGPKGQNESK